jgi:uncharacterized protein (DUF1330 family)
MSLRFPVRGEHMEVVEVSWRPMHAVVTEFPSLGHAKRWSDATA